jgi:hypothetical protein
MSTQECDNGETSLPYGEVNWETNFRENPEEYTIGRGQFGVLKAEPYKSEILPHWSYKDKQSAEKSAYRILRLFYWYVDDRDFVGADMAKKYLHMGFTRAMRYAKYPGGEKYKDNGDQKQPHGPDTTGGWADPSKRRAAVVFRKAWKEARNNDTYNSLKTLHDKGELYKQQSLSNY